MHASCIYRMIKLGLGIGHDDTAASEESSAKPAGGAGDERTIPRMLPKDRPENVLYSGLWKNEIYINYET